MNKAPEPLNRWERKLLDFIEQYWHMNQGKFPTQKALINYGKLGGFDNEQVEIMVDRVEPYLKNRGIKRDDGIQLLEDRQLAAANLVYNFADKRSFAAKLRSLGVTPTEWHGWTRQEAFRKYANIKTGQLFEENAHVARMGLLAAAERGEPAAIKLFLEVTGELRRDQSDQVDNIKIVLARFFEILQINIKDREVLGKIADEFEAVVNGTVAVNQLLEKIEQKQLEPANPVTPNPVMGASLGRTTSLANVRVSGNNSDDDDILKPVGKETKKEDKKEEEVYDTPVDEFDLFNL